MIKKFTNVLASRDFAIFIMVVSTGLLIIWRVRPDYYSPFFLAAPAFIFASISICTLTRVSENSFKDVRFAGSFIFHVGMLVTIASASFGAFTAVFGRVTLLQGVAVPLDASGFSEKARSLLNYDKIDFITLRLDELKTTYEQEKYPVRHSASISFGVLEEAGFRSMKERVEINKPFDLEKYRFLLENGGYAPRLVLTDENGKTLYDGYIQLSSKLLAESVIDLPGTDYVLYTRFFPDYFRIGKEVGTRSPVLNNPAVGLELNKKKGPMEAPVWSGVLRQGERADFDGMTLAFRDLIPYVVILVVSDPSTTWVAGGWLLIVLGLLVRYLPLMGVREAV